MSETNQAPEAQPSADAPATPAAAPAAPAAAPAARKQPAAQQPARAPAPKAGAAAPVMHMPRNRHDVAFRHDVFKADVQKCVRNYSYEFMKFEKVEQEHTHIYHSHNNSGRKLTRTNSSCNHWHNVEHHVDPVTGATRAVCGPPMHEVTKTSETGRSYTVVEQVSFEEEITVGEDAGKIKKHVDNHRHEFLYIGSEDLSPAGISSALKEQRALATAMGMSLDPSSIKDNTPAAMTPADGADIR